MHARLRKVRRDESRTQGLDRLELIRAAAVRIEDYADTLRGHRVIRLVGKGNKPAVHVLTAFVTAV
ncbi:MAG TPA: hypothetical protein VES95_02960 [Dermatophilaceae bacterium]|nr:hypothetical protein [Dermatophilaceae bacterium]